MGNSRQHSRYILILLINFTILHKSTFQAACKEMGLLEGDDELDRVVEEAATVSFGNQLRDVFANIMIYCRPADPLQFWNRHKSSLCEDYR